MNTAPVVGGGNRLGDAEAKVLAQSPGAASLRVLELSSNLIGDAGALALARSPYLHGLRKLLLYNNPIGGSGWAALERSFDERAEW